MANGKADLAALLGTSIGVQAAQQAIGEAASEIGISGEALTREQALAILEHIANNQGLVGIAARFAKSKVHLKWDDS